MRTDILGVSFDPLTLADAVQRADALLAEGPGHYVVTPNSEIVYLCRKEPGLVSVLNNASLVLPDGIGVIYAARILGRPLPCKVAGIDFAAALLPLLAERGKKLFLLGAKPGVAEAAAQKMQEQHPELIICGTHDGYYSDEQAVLEEINASGADVVFVCLGAPRQEYFMANHCAELSASLLVGLGGSLDVFAGNVKRAPNLMIRLGLEWLYRLIREPWRFTRMCRLPLFLFSAIGARLRGK